MNRTFSSFDANNPVSGAFDGEWMGSGRVGTVVSPVTGEVIGKVAVANAEECDKVIASSHHAFQQWKLVPAPVRAEVVRRLGQALRDHKEELAQLVTLEMGKPIGESLGEVQEMIDICDFAVGLGRQVGGITFPSERAGHRLMEQWHPLGVVGVVTAFNFPVAVWAWNAALALVCGDTVIWKPSSKTPLTAIACTRIAAKVLEENGHPAAILGLVIGSGRDVGDRLISDKRVALVSYTGSVATGRYVGAKVQERFGRTILELGGNNAAIISSKADLDQAAVAVWFGAIGTAGQRCTSTRRLIVQDEIYDSFMERLMSLYNQLRIGDTRSREFMMGPLVDPAAVETMLHAVETARQQGAKVVLEPRKLPELGESYITPCVAEVTPDMGIVQEETFAPILWVMRYKTLEEAIAIQNGVPQGLSSSLFSNDMLECERFISAAGSDCGMANVNAGTSGAEIGGAFGGEKETGGGRESGSDSWKAYMRRLTSTINYSGKVELAQGIRISTEPATK